MEQGLLCLLVPCYAFYYIVLALGGYERGVRARAAAGRETSCCCSGSLMQSGWRMVAMRLTSPVSGRPHEVARLPREIRRWPPAFGPRGGIPPRVGRPRNPGIDARAKILDFVDRTWRSGGHVLIFTGIPTNSDPAKGVTARDVSEAILARIRALVAGRDRTFCGSARNNRLALALSPVDDIAAFAQRIDFGTATVRGNRDRCRPFARIRRVGAEIAPRGTGHCRKSRHDGAERRA